MISKRFLFLPILLLGVILASCRKDDSSGKQSIELTSKAIVSVSTNSLVLSLPGNCQQSFTISNTGPEGTSLDFTVKDDGPDPGLLSFTNGSGTLAAGQSATITVTIKIDSTGNTPIPTGKSLVLNVYTPNAANNVKVPITVGVYNNYAAYNKLLGTWSGTWTGRSLDTVGGLQEITQVNGTWQVTFLSVDTVKGAISGTLAWKGQDTYWTDQNTGNGFADHLPYDLNIDKQINFNASNSTITIDPMSPCSAFKITIGYNGLQGSLSATDFYGPWVTANFDIDTQKADNNQKIAVGTITTEGFLTHPYNPTTLMTESFPSRGFLSGVKN